jgi:hypothetical protein
MVGLGLAEFVGGAGILIETGGVGFVPGVALTASGYDAMTQGMRMWTSPKESDHSRGWVGDAAHRLGVNLGWDDAVNPFDAGWMMIQIGAGFGATPALLRPKLPLSKVYHNDTVANSIDGGMLTKAELALGYLKGLKGAKGLKLDLFPLPSGRGIVAELEGGKRFLIPSWESMIRVLQRIKNSKAEYVQERLRKTEAGDAGFAFGSEITNLGHAHKLVFEVAAHMGIQSKDLKNYISGIEFGLVKVNGAPKSSSFSPRRVLHVSKRIGLPLDPNSNNQTYSQLRAIIEIAHELNHAMIFKRYIERGGSIEKYQKSRFVQVSGVRSRVETDNYFNDEVIVETNARDFVQKLTHKRMDDLISQGDLKNIKQMRMLLATVLRESKIYIRKYKDDKESYLVNHRGKKP